MFDDGREVVIAASSSEETIAVWDVHTGTFLTTYKGNTSGRNSFKALGRDYLVAAQAGKGKALHAWAWHKDQVHLRSFAPENLTSVACTPDGCYLAGGGEKGTVYIWEAGSGRLLTSFSAHYKAVSALAFTDDSALLISGGTDSAVHVWLLMQLLDASAKPDTNAAVPEPLHSWMGHSLAVTGLHVGPGAAPLVASVSDDRTCRVWSTALGRHLHTQTLPARLCCVVADAWQHSLVAGAADGRIFLTSLLALSAQQGAEVPASSAAAPADSATLAGHSGPVECLTFTESGYFLVSGGTDSTIRVWDVQTREVKLVVNAKGPITGLLVLRKPPHMVLQRAGDSGKRGPSRQQPLAPLRKFFDQPETAQAWQGPPVLLDGSQPYRCVVAESGLLQSAEQAPEEVNGAGNAPATEVAKMKAANEKLEEQLAAAAKTISELRDVNTKMHAFLVESNLAE